MKSFFTKTFFAANRQQLLNLTAPKCTVLLTANGLLQRGADGTYPFAQDANFWYLTGIDEPDLILVMAADEEFIIVPSRDKNRQAFDGNIDTVALKNRSGIAKIMDSETGWERLKQLIKDTGSVATVRAAPSYLEHYGMYTNPARRRLLAQIKEVQADTDIIDIGKAIVGMRMVKQPEELAAIQAAIDITVETLQALTEPALLKQYRHEYELEADITRGFRSRGSSGHAFEPIVAGGPRACTLHNVANNSPLKPDELIVIDVGAEVEHYAADITRSVHQGVPSARQHAVLVAVQDVQTYAAALLKPGIVLRDYEKQVEHYMGKALQKLGLIKAITYENVRHYYPHATSHFMGLNVHDAGDYARPLEPGMVLTVEPGIYIPEEGIGVRIEDDVLITQDGNEMLTNKLSR